jgi:3-carboxy-cis,cis-muconate cycloisomerase
LIGHWDGLTLAAVRGLGRLAERHAETPVAARTYGQIAVPTSFGAMAAGWGRPLLASRARLAALELPVSLGGAAGTLAAMGRGPAGARAPRRAPRPRRPGASWHGDRRPVGALVAALTELLGSLGKMGEDVLLLAQSGIGELRVAGAGGSSTMPQKATPWDPRRWWRWRAWGSGWLGWCMARRCTARAGTARPG